MPERETTFAAERDLIQRARSDAFASRRVDLEAGYADVIVRAAQMRRGAVGRRRLGVPQWMSAVGARLVEVVNKWLAVSTWIRVAAAFVLILMVGAIVVMVSGSDDVDDWSRLAYAGESFGAVGAVAAGMAFVGLTVTLWMQAGQLRVQRSELASQRELLNMQRTELHRSAEVSLRTLHSDLMKMALDDPALEHVWPPLEPGAPPERNRQHLYANLIFQHLSLSIRLGGYTDVQVEQQLRYLFVSPLMRKYWRASAHARSLVTFDERGLFETAERICNEYEDILASASDAAMTGSQSLPESSSLSTWAHLDHGAATD